MSVFVKGEGYGFVVAIVVLARLRTVSHGARLEVEPSGCRWALPGAPSSGVPVGLRVRQRPSLDSHARVTMGPDRFGRKNAGISAQRLPLRLSADNWYPKARRLIARCIFSTIASASVDGGIIGGQRGRRKAAGPLVLNLVKNPIGANVLFMVQVF